MKKIIIFGLILLTGIIFNTSIAFADVYVNGYYRDNGTYVEGYWRSSPDSDPTNNYSYPGNTNPYTGVVAPGNANTYLNNYNKKAVVPSTNSIEAGWDKLRKDNEATQKSSEAMLLRAKLDSLSNQIKQNSSGNACYYPSYPSCSEREKQGIMTEWEQAKSRASALNFKMGVTGSGADTTNLSNVDNEYSNKLKMCQDSIDANNKLIELYNQCKTDQSNSQAKLLELQRQYQEANKATEAQPSPQNNTAVDGRVTRMVACIKYLGVDALKNSENENAYSIDQCKCPNGSEIIGGKCVNKVEEDKSCKKSFNEHSYFKGMTTYMSSSVPECICEAGYSIDPTTIKCVPTIQKDQKTPVSYAEWVATGKPDKNGVVSETEGNSKVTNKSAIIPNSNSCYIFKNIMQVDSTGTDVVVLQNFLKTKGFLSTSTPTSLFGRQTKEALMKYQSSIDLLPTGYAGSITISNLNEECLQIPTLEEKKVSDSEIDQSTSTINKYVQKESAIQRLGVWFSRLFK